MKKNGCLKKNQYYPFDDFRPPVAVSFEDPKIQDDVSWKALIKGIKKSRTLDSWALTYLVHQYQKRAKIDGIDKALVEFWSLVGSWQVKPPSKKELANYIETMTDENLKNWLSKAGPGVKGLSFITNEMRLSLYRAQAGELEDAQVIVRACPDAIHLPFIASAIASVVQTYKYAKIGKKISGRDAYLEDGEEPERTPLLKPFRKTYWDAFLPKRTRTGGDLPYTHEDKRRVRIKARKQGADITEVAKEMGIGERALRDKAKIEKGRGRPKKTAKVNDN